MIIYFAGQVIGDELREGRVLTECESRLHSYYYVDCKPTGKKCFDFAVNLKKKILAGESQQKLRIFLDSGAFSAETQGAAIDIARYAEFIKGMSEYLEVYASLDVIGDPKGTLENQKRMEDLGVKPLPCFHRGEPFSYLEYYLEKYDYLALGGMVTATNRDSLPSWLDTVFDKYICDKDGLPKIKVHGFGMTTFRFMRRYPWYSVDSTSWLAGGRRGAVYVPPYRNGKWDYNANPRDIVVSNRSGERSVEGAHFDNLSKGEQDVIMAYFKEKGFGLGVSSFRTELKGYKLKENEIWAVQPVSGTGKVEILEESGLANNYMDRNVINVRYFKDYERTFQEFPTRFDRRNMNRGFFI